MTLMRHSLLIPILIFFFSIIRLIPILNNPTCFADDCLPYLNAIKGELFFKEPLFHIITMPLYTLGINDIWVMRILMVSLPLFFSIGLYVLMRNRFKPTTVLIAIIAANIFLPINLFWFVMIRNGLMLVFLPFFLHYYTDEKYKISLVFFLLMAASHTTFFFFAIPILIHSLYRKNIYFSMALGLITVGLMPFYYQGYQLIIEKSGIAFLNYMLMDILFLFFSVLAIIKQKMDVFKTIFIIDAILCLLFFMFYIEGWRIIILMNIPVLFVAIKFIDEYWEKFKILVKLYLMVSFVFFLYYLITLKSL